MERSRLLDAQVQAKRIYNLLGEVMDLSRQLAEAVDRNDQVSVQMLLAMREDPIQGLTVARAALKQQIESAPPEDAGRLQELLSGSPAKNSEESGLADQAAANERLLRQVQELDKALSKKIARDKSFYQ